MSPVVTHVVRLVGVSAAFLICFWITTVALPMVTSQSGYRGVDAASLLFLPHGVRVIAAWLYGWKAVLYLAPASYAAHFFRFQFQFDTLGEFLMPIFGIVCVSAVFAITARAGVDLRLRAGHVARWHIVLLVGAVASLVNAVGTNLIVGNPVSTMLYYLVGDILGMIALFLILMLAFRGMRRFGY